MTPSDFHAARRALARNWPELESESPTYKARLEALAAFHANLGSSRFELYQNLRDPGLRPIFFFVALATIAATIGRMIAPEVTEGPEVTTVDPAEALRRHVHRFLRSFGLLAAGTTPCGQPLPVSYAHALLVLREASIEVEEEGLTMGDLARELGIDKSNVTRLCRRMERDGHLDIRQCTADGRVRRLHLTESGRRLATQVDRSSLRRFERLLSHVPEKRAGELLRGLHTLREAIHALTKKETR